MHFTHDPIQDFYYMGEEQPHSRTYNQLIRESNHSLISVDIESISLKEKIAVGIGIALNRGTAMYFPLFPEPSPATPWELLRNPAVSKVYHNAPFDLSCTREFEFDITNILDTNLMARLIGFKDSRLSDLSPMVDMPTRDMKYVLVEHKAKTTLDLPREVLARKCMEDCIATLRLYGELKPRVNAEYFNVEMQVITILTEMSYRGILIDQEARAEWEEKLQVEVDYYRDICEGIGFSPGSSQQIGYTLAKRGAYSVFRKLPFTKRVGGQLKTDDDTLNKMDDPLASIIRTYKSKSKLLGTYIKPWRDETYAYTRFHMDAVTGRPSSTDRNMQNIPKPTRNILIPENGVFTDSDFFQIELRALAHISGDEEMQYIFSLPRLNPDGTINIEADIHQQTANFLGVPRLIAKSVNFAVVYGATDETLMETAGIRDIRRAQELKYNWFRRFNGAGDYIQTVQEECIKNPFVTTIFGRHIPLPTEEEESIDRIQRKAVNYPIQGSAAEIMKRGLILCRDMDMRLQVHDEILVDGFVRMPEALERIAPFPTPIDVKYLQCWE